MLSDKLSYSELRSRPFVPMVHPNGFVTLDLGDSQRLHVWPTTPLQARKVPTPIHDHIFDFESVVLKGELLHIVYDIEDARSGAFHLYEVPDSRVKLHAPLVRIDQYCYRAVPVKKLWVPEGRNYSFEAFRFHETIPLGLTATVFTRSPLDLRRKPKILCPAEKIPDNSFRRDAHDTEFLWKLIRTALE